MNEEKFQEWRNSTRQEVFAQIILNKLYKEKKITRKQRNEIQKKIDAIGYKNFINSPHLEGKEELTKKAMVLCFEDYCRKNKSSYNTRKVKA